MNTKALFHCGGGSNVIGMDRENQQIFFLKIPANVKFFHQTVKK